MSTITYQHGVMSLIGDAPHDDFHMLCDGRLTGLGYFVDPAPNQASNAFTFQVNEGEARSVSIRRWDDDKDRYMLVHVPSGMTFHFFFYSEVHVKAHAQAIFEIGLDWTQPVEVLQQHPLWADMGRRNQEIIAGILDRL